MEKQDGWLGWNPSTALEDWDFAIATEMSMCMCVQAISVEKHMVARGPSRDNSLGEINAGGSYQ